MGFEPVRDVVGSRPTVAVAVLAGEAMAGSSSGQEHGYHGRVDMAHLAQPSKTEKFRPADGSSTLDG